MERLNSILGRTGRPSRSGNPAAQPRHLQQSEEQATPEGTTHAGGIAGQGVRQSSSARYTQQMPTTRRYLPEQRAQLGKPPMRGAQQHPAENQPRGLPPHAYLRNAQASRSRNPIDPYAQQERPGERAMPTEYQEEMDALPNTRPPYTRSRPPMDAAPAPYPQRTRPKQDMQRTHPMQTLPSANNYYHTDDHGPALPADVYTDQDMMDEEDDDAARAMLYGDYLDDDEYEEMEGIERMEEVAEEEEMGEVPVYQREDFTRLPAPRSNYPRMTREIEALPAPGMQPRPTRDLRTTPNAQPAAQLQARTQEMKRYNRTTQPLNPQVVAEMQRERELPAVSQQVPQPARTARQMAVREQSRVPARLTPIPPSVMPPAARAVCPRCRGAGYLRLDVPFGHPNFGKPIACECKEAERKEKRRQQLREMSNLDAHHSQTFRTFNPRVPGVKEAYEVAHEYAQGPEGWLLLIGPNGSGKTHLAAAIANQSLDNGAVVLFSVVPDLLDHLRAAFAPNATEVYDQLFSKMREAEVLVLDDLGAQQSSPWANEKLFQLLNYRYNMGMPTVITANPRGLQGIDERIRSRLADVSLVMSVNLDRARDYRPNHPRRRD